MGYKPLIQSEIGLLQDKCRHLEKENMALKLKAKEIKARILAFRQNYKAMIRNADIIVGLLK